MRPALPGYSSKFAYSIYLCSGILVWQLFSDLLNRSVGVFVHNANLLKKANLPKVALPVIVTLSALSNFAVIALLFIAFLVAVGEFTGLVIFAFVPLIVLVIALAIGIGVLLGTINVFYRDVEQSTSMLLQLAFWLTPSSIPGARCHSLSPKYLPGTRCGRSSNSCTSIFLDARVPPWSMLVYPTTIAALFLDARAVRVP